MLVKYAVILFLAGRLSLTNWFMFTFSKVELIESLFCPLLKLPRARLHRGKLLG